MNTLSFPKDIGVHVAENGMIGRKYSVWWRKDMKVKTASEIVSLWRMSNPKLSLLTKFRLKMGNWIFVGYYELPGWSGELPFYIKRCGKHGYVATYPAGRGRLVCPICLRESM